MRGKATKGNKGATPASSPGGIQRYMLAESSILEEPQGSPRSGAPIRPGINRQKGTKWFYGDAGSVHSEGVAIGFDRTMMFVEEERLANPGGRYLFVKRKLFDTWVTVANIYSPNSNPENFLRKVLMKLETFKKGKLIVAGDLNLCMDPEIDHQGAGQNRVYKARHLKKC